MIKRGNRATAEILVKWQGEEKEAATWENYTDLINKHPGFDLGARSLRGEDCWAC